MLLLNLRRATTGVLVPLLASALIACNGSGDTGGSDSSNPGDRFVDNGGAGSTLKITADSTINVGQSKEFFVTATDANGVPLSFIRVSCESEHGIAILEPSRGGVAFEHTGSAGVMSGVLGGVAPGSYLLECRGPQGFNLLDRVSIKVQGSVPNGFVGFPGAAGGNLGGGLTPDPRDRDVNLARAEFIDSSATARAIAGASVSCDESGSSYQLTINNASDDALFVDNVTFTVAELGISVGQDFNGLTIDANSEVDLVGAFTDVVGGEAVFAGTSTAIQAGSYAVTFTVTGSSENGAPFTINRSAPVTVSGGSC